MCSQFSLININLIIFVICFLFITNFCKFGVSVLRDIMPLTGFSFLSDTRIKLVILLILALQVISVIVFYHQHSIIKKELTCRRNQEQLYGKQSSLWTEGSDMDISVTVSYTHLDVYKRQI